jgi:hypothetical protein
MLTYLFPDHNGTRQVFAVNLPVSLALAGSAVADKKDTSLSSSSASVSATNYSDIEIGKKKKAKLAIA